MPLKARVWTVGKVLLLAGALVATFFLFALVSMRVALRARDVEVPNLVGATVENASLTVTNLGLALRIDPNQRPDERVPAGGIMQQDPAPGVVARRQRSIRVWVSSGPRRTTVPGLVGQNERTARMRVDEEGLEVATVSEFRTTCGLGSASVPTGIRRPWIASPTTSSTGKRPRRSMFDEGCRDGSCDRLPTALRAGGVSGMGAARR